jgi:aryl-alcohol dehydrogenase-like predicted oxidoreductase
MAKVPTRQLGKNGPQVSALGFGAMGLSAFYGTPASDEERFKVFDRAIELGCTYFDSADIYGDNEELLGKYFKKYPEQRKKVSKRNKRIVTTPSPSRNLFLILTINQ